MKIAYIYYTDHDPKSAHNNQIIHTCNALFQAGHNITVFTAGGLESYADEHGLTLLFDIYNSYSLKQSQTISQLIYYIEALKTGRSYDVILTRDISFLKFLTLIPDFFVPAITFEAHKCYTIVDGMSRNEERQRLNQADKIIAISEGIQTDIEHLGVTVDAVVRDAAETDYVPTTPKRDMRNNLGIDRNTTVFVYAGSLDSGKYDLKSVINAFASIAQENNNVLYVLGGNETNINRLQRYAKTVGIRNQVHFVGHISQKRVFEYLKASDVGIVAQQPTDIRASKYTSPLKLFEYLICGLVVVATDVPSIAEIADNEPRILTYDPDKSRELVSVLETAATEHKLLELSNPNKRYSYKHRAEAILSVLDECVSRNTCSEVYSA